MIRSVLPVAVVSTSSGRSNNFAKIMDDDSLSPRSNKIYIPRPDFSALHGAGPISALFLAVEVANEGLELPLRKDAVAATFSSPSKQRLFGRMLDFFKIQSLAVGFDSAIFASNDTQ